MHFQIEKLSLEDPENIDKFYKLFMDVVGSCPYYPQYVKDKEIKTYSNISMSEFDVLKKIYLIAKLDNGEICGFCIGQEDCETYFLNWIGVNKKCRKIGIANALVEQFEREVTKQGGNKIWLDTRTNNIESINLFKKLKYNKLVEVKKHWYGLDFYLWDKLL